MHSCASIAHVFIASVNSAVAIGGCRPLSSLNELLSTAVRTASYCMLLMANLYQMLLNGSLAKYCWMLDRSEIVVDPAVCGRTDGWDVVVDGMLRRKSSSQPS